MRIEMVGGLGVGKSTLCQALEQIGFNCIYENLHTNPFLADCFQNPEAFRFPSQMWFVLSKYHEIRKFEKPGRVNVLDQSVLNVKAYTNMLFHDDGQCRDPGALAIIRQCFDYMDFKTGRSGLLIYLKCSPQEQMRRIRSRNRAHEKDVTLDYITTLQDAIDHVVNEARAEGQAVMDIDTENVYMPDNLDYAEQLARNLAKMFNVEFESFVPQQPVLAKAEEWRKLKEAV